MTASTFNTKPESMSLDEPRESLKLIVEPVENVSQCTCPICDSLECFSKRIEANTSCACKECADPDTCLSRNDKMPSAVHISNNEITEITQKEETVGPINVDKSDEMKHDPSRHFLELYKKENSKETNKQSTFVYKSTEYETKNQTDKIENPKEIPIKVHSVSINFSQKANISRAKLSAQIMNIPYDIKKIEREIEPPLKTISLGPIEQTLLTKIKAIYNACSCKVCDCITGKSLNVKNDECKCKPCECSDCAKFNIKLREASGYAPHDGCPCVSCDRNACKGVVPKIVKSKPPCNCKPCDCIKCSDSFSKGCDCEPCQCIECESKSIRVPRSMVVASVTEHTRQYTGQCSTCDCGNCGYNNTTSDTKIETSPNRRRTYCNCARCINEICLSDALKPCDCEGNDKTTTLYDKGNWDFDIRRVRVDKDCNINERNYVTRGRYDTCAVYSAPHKNYPNIACDECKCAECECLNCKYKENRMLKILEHKSKNYMKPFVLGEDLCQCSPCDCLACDSVFQERMTSHGIFRKCKCDTCYCIRCGESHIDIEADEPRKPCDKFKSFNNYDKSDESLYPIKKGLPLSPSYIKYGNISPQPKTIKRYIPEMETHKRYQHAWNQPKDWNQNLVLCQQKAKHQNLVRCSFDRPQHPSDIEIASSSAENFKKEKFQDDISENLFLVCEYKEPSPTQSSAIFEIEMIRNQYADTKNRINFSSKYDNNDTLSLINLPRKLSPVHRQFHRQFITHEFGPNKEIEPVKPESYNAMTAIAAIRKSGEKIKELTKRPTDFNFHNEKDMDYERIENVLKEAKNISVDLDKILKKHQKANDNCKNDVYLKKYKKYPTLKEISNEDDFDNEN